MKLNFGDIILSNDHGVTDWNGLRVGLFEAVVATLGLLEGDIL